MSISRNNRTYYTKEEYEAAKRNDNALFYAQRQGYDLVRTGRYFYMRQHDSPIHGVSLLSEKMNSFVSPYRQQVPGR